METAETNEELGADMEAINEQIKAVDKLIRKLGSRFDIVVPDLVAKLWKLGFRFERSQENTVITNQENRVVIGIDVFLENDDRTMVVETREKPSAADIDEHIERMENLRRYADSRNDKRKYLGAIAGAVFGDSVKTYALKEGLYVIESSGNTFNIIESAGDCRPREW